MVDGITKACWIKRASLLKFRNGLCFNGKEVPVAIKVDFINSKEDELMDSDFNLNALLADSFTRAIAEAEDL